EDGVRARRPGSVDGVMTALVDAGVVAHLPAGTLPLVIRWLEPHHCSVKVTGPRRTKKGDFRAPHRGKGAAITVNRDLGPLQFVLTLTHEIAHLHTWASSRRRVRPHGPEWKDRFAALLRELAGVGSLPEPYRLALLAHADRPRSTASIDLHLWSVLQELEGDDDCLLDSLVPGARFGYRGRRFEKVRTARTRCLCRDLGNDRQYFISRMAPVHPE
ncbi:MAG: SprT-like domain-containing protein, partial [Myxococcota bacterium]|nr:SprT-like domain-containing protein [Myxococcota bacterium]